MSQIVKSMMQSSEKLNRNHHHYIVEIENKNKRLDQYLSQKNLDHSRAQIQQWIKRDLVQVNQRTCKPNYKVQAEDQIEVVIPESKPIDHKAQAIALDIVYEDESLLIINKPAGLTVHPGAGNPDKTLLNALLHHDESLAKLPRAGIIHRLDKMTTGLMLVPKNEHAFHHLSQAMQSREISRHYLALVRGAMIAGTSVDAPIGRHPKNRLKMAVIDQGKTAVTHIRIAQKFRHYTLLQCELETGRTHQIRVHCQMHGYPIVGDPLYADKHSLVKGIDANLRPIIQSFKRQALHAFCLSFKHPQTQELCEFKVDPPEDFQSLLHELARLDSL